MNRKNWLSWLLMLAVFIPACTLFPMATPTPTRTAALTPSIVDVETNVPTDLPRPTAPTFVLPTGTIAYFTDTPAPTETLRTPLTMPYLNMSDLLRGVCSAYLQTLAGQTLRFGLADDLNAFYTAADKSKKCPEPVTRGSFDFASQNLIGTVITGQGCSFVLAYGSTQTSGTDRTISFRASPVGDCGYTLLEPLLIAVDKNANTSLQILANP